MHGVSIEPLVGVATVARRIVWTTLAAGVFVTVSLSMFDAGRQDAERHGSERQVTVRAVTGPDSAGPDLVREAVERFEAGGLTCTDLPALTDHIVFERHDGVVEMLGFDEAWARAGADLGWVRSYCVR